MGDEPDIREQLFHNTVRENIIFLLLFALLYVVSFIVLGQLRRREKDELLVSDEAETTVYNISLLLSALSLSVSTGAALLLPISIVSNEILLLYPESYYMQWLNSSLIQGLWNHVFLFSNLSLFVFLPFAYLLMESEGFLGSQKGLWARIQETFVILMLMASLVLGMVFVISSIIDSDHASPDRIRDLCTYYLPFLYSCISFAGVLMLLLCTPLGFVRLFTVASQFLVKPQFLRNLDEEFEIARLEEYSLRRRLKFAQMSGKSYISPPPMTPPQGDQVRQRLLSLQNGALQFGLDRVLKDSEEHSELLDLQRHASVVQRNLVYPICMLLLFTLTAIAVLMVVQNTLGLLVGIKALPLSTKQFTLGSSLSKLGPFGAALEVVLIIYIKATSLVGFYTLPGVSSIRPRRNATSLPYIIINCAFLLILTSALPLISRILGITNFDLLGDFGQIEWLGNFKIVLAYNVLFAAAATLCLVNKFTAKVRRDLFLRLSSFVLGLTRYENLHTTLSPSTSFN